MTDDKITLHTGQLDDRRIDFDAESRTIIVDDSGLTADEIEDVARLGALAVSALVPGVSLTGSQAEILVEVIVEIVEMARSDQ